MSSARKTESMGNVTVGNFPLMDKVLRALLESIMECEMDELLGYDKHKRREMVRNYRNGYSRKTLKTQYGKLSIRIPRDRNGEYEPMILPKFRRCDTDLERKISELYRTSMTDGNIEARVRDMYNDRASGELVLRIVSKLEPVLECLRCGE